MEEVGEVGHAAGGDTRVMRIAVCYLLLQTSHLLYHHILGLGTISPMCHSAQLRHGFAQVRQIALLFVGVLLSLGWAGGDEHLVSVVREQAVATKGVENLEIMVRQVHQQQVQTPIGISPHLTQILESQCLIHLLDTLTS